MKHFLLSFLMLGTVGAFSFLQMSCSDSADARPDYVFKHAGSTEDPVMVKFGDIEVKQSELVGDRVSDHFELKKRVFEFLMDRTESVLVNKVVEAGLKEKGKDLNREQFMDKYVYKSKDKVTTAEIEAFIKDRNIPKSQDNELMRSRIDEFLKAEKRKELELAYLSSAGTKDAKVEILFERPQPPRFEVPVGNAPIHGPKDAPVAIVEYSDFECPYCSRGAQTVEALKKKYGNKVKLAYKHFPLNFHKNAKPAAIAAMCAHDQDKFWPYHDKLFAKQESLNTDTYMEIAKSLKLNETKFKECVDSGTHGEKIDADMKEVEALKLPVDSTPTFFINGIKLAGARDVEAFSEIIDQELQGSRQN